ncbi:hypothetical protein [Parvibaculum sp.]|uniref:hypothetical protein n=1 Tax=Parvibaculum sp. TaxID=2024848 RepID=UPI00320C4606
METKPTAPFIERLNEFLSRLTPGTAAKLAAGLEREKMRGGTGLPYDLILSSIRPLLGKREGQRPGAPSVLRQFCMPFEDLLTDDRSPSPHMPHIRRSSIMPVWAWLETELLPDTLPDIARRLEEKTGGADGIAQKGSLTVLHASSSSAILSAFDESRKDGALRRKMERQLGGENVVEDARTIGRTLAVAPYLLAVRDALPRHIVDFDEGMVATVAELYDEARATSLDSAIYVPLIAVARMHEPWQILRLARKLAGFSNEDAVNRSGLAGLGEIFLGELEEIAEKVQPRRAVPLDLDDLLSKITQFAELSQNFIREIDVRRCSDWGNRILAARARLSTALTEAMAKFELELARALPLHQVGSYGRNGPRRPDISTAPNFERNEKMLACLRFLRGVASAAESIGAQSHCRTVGQQIEAYLSSYEDGLIEDLRRAKGPQLANAQAYLEMVIACRETLGDAGIAATLRRRGQVAVAQAS